MSNENFFITVKQEYRDPNGVKHLRSTDLLCNLNKEGRIYFVGIMLNPTETKAL